MPTAGWQQTRCRAGSPRPYPGRVDVDVLLRALDAALSERTPSADGRARLARVERLPRRDPVTADLPDDLSESVSQRLQLAGITSLYAHQAEALDHLRAGRHVVVATGPASGKSLCYQLPLLDRLSRDDKATALYLSPTKALARDQLRALRDFRLPHVRAAAYDGDTPPREREAIRRTANVVLTNPDMLHMGILPQHERWSDFLHRLTLVIVDECHVARGVFGSHVSAIIRRLRRLCAHYAGDPKFVLASATIANPAEHAAQLTGLDVEAITQDGSPRPPVTLGMWEPPLEDERTGARRSTLAEAADLLARLVDSDQPWENRKTLTFVKSRKGAEIVAATARRLVGPTAQGRIYAYRAGHLADERRAVEQGLADDSVRGVAATNALELGVDIGTLDAVVIAGWPGTAASLWQQAGRAGRREREAVVVFVADDNPLDHYLLAHPDQLWGRPVEAAVVDVTNPSILAPHVCCAAYELALSESETTLPSEALADVVAAEIAAGRLRQRSPGVVTWAGRGSPPTGVHIRSAGGEPVAIVEADTGALVGEVDQARAHHTVHDGAVYLHQGTSYRIERLNLRDGVARARRFDGDEYTRPRSDTDIAVLASQAEVGWGRCGYHRGDVEVTTQVLAYERRRVGSDESLGLVGLDLPRQHLRTKALWLTVPDAVLADAGLAAPQVPGAAHALEHAAIGLIGLFAMCDRWDVGGVSTARHPDTGLATIFIYDGYPGGAGITERGFASDDALLRATLAAISACPCAQGCPSCVQSPKCGNGNEPLDKAGALALLETVLSERATPRSSAVRG